MSNEDFDPTDADRDIQEIFKGSYKYKREGRTYGNENFSVYKDFESQAITFMSEIVSRVATGEFLKINTVYSINIKHEPIFVKIEKSLGTNYSKESYTPDRNAHQVLYEFQGGNETKTMRIQTPAKYHIATPATCTSLVFTKAKKYDPTILNSYYILSSENIWDYSKSLDSSTVYFRCDNIHVQEEVTINKKTLSGTKFDIFLEDKETPEKITYFVSKHFAIPYKVTVDRNTVVEIQNLQDLSPSRMEDFLK